MIGQKAVPGWWPGPSHPGRASSWRRHRATGRWCERCAPTAAGCGPSPADWAGPAQPRRRGHRTAAARGGQPPRASAGTGRRRRPRRRWWRGWRWWSCSALASCQDIHIYIYISNGKKRNIITITITNSNSNHSYLYVSLKWK